MENVKFAILTFLLMIYSVYGAPNDNVTSLYAVPLLGLFVTSMIVVIVWVMYKDKFANTE